MTKKEKSAFTLAEVLITLGVIGVVAALTLPILTANHRKKVIETRLAKFYTTMNEAIRMSETANGDRLYWDYLGQGFDKDENQNTDYSRSLPMEWYEKYLKSFINTEKTEINPVTGKVMIYFNDGSLCSFGGASLQFYPSAKDFEEYQLTEENKIKNNMEISGIKYFTFFYYPNKLSPELRKKGVEAYGIENDKDTLLNDPNVGCNQNPTNERAYCAALIQLNGWKIPSDYPLKF